MDQLNTAFAFAQETEKRLRSNTPDFPFEITRKLNFSTETADLNFIKDKALVAKIEFKRIPSDKKNSSFEIQMFDENGSLKLLKLVIIDKEHPISTQAAKVAKWGEPLLHLEPSTKIETE